MNEEYQKAIEWVDARLAEPDIKDFYLEPHMFCYSLHKTLKVSRANLLICKYSAQKTAYYQIKKIKDNYEKFTKN